MGSVGIVWIIGRVGVVGASRTSAIPFALCGGEDFISSLDC